MADTAKPRKPRIEAYGHGDRTRLNNPPVGAVNQHGGFGRWASATSRHLGEIDGILQREGAQGLGVP